MIMRCCVGLLAAGILVANAFAATDQPGYQLHYSATIHPETQSAAVTMQIPDAALLHKLDFNIDPNLHSNFKGNGTLKVKGGRAVWEPPTEDAILQWDVRLQNERDPGEFDAYITEDWAIFRGDDLIPPARVETDGKAFADASLEFSLPESWPSVNTGWESTGPRSFAIDNPERQFDRPTGWMIAGKLGTRRETIAGTELAVSAPKDSGLRRMDIIAFLTLAWPEAETAFGDMPRKLLIVGNGDPMWRGGLSAPNSLFLHRDRPLVSENGTSPLLHELVHMVTGIVGEKGHDWIAEGLTEFYSVELLYRAGAMTEDRREETFEGLAEWSENVERLIKKQSTGAVTARAAVLFEALDREIRERSEHSIDSLARGLMREDKVSLGDVESLCKELVGDECKTLKTPLLSNGN